MPELDEFKVFKHFFINSRTFKALNFCYQTQAHLSTFKFCTNPVYKPIPLLSGLQIIILFEKRSGQTFYEFLSGNFNRTSFVVGLNLAVGASSMSHH